MTDAVATQTLTRPVPRRSRIGRGHLVAYSVVVATAFCARFAVVATSGGLTGSFQYYDASVYYAAGDAFSFGRLPYRDFVLLHPPGSMLALAPFAVLGRIVGDHVGFMVAVVAFMALGAANAALAVRVLERMGVGLGAATAGGLFYAVWLGSVWAEYQIRLEPLGNFFVLCGLLAYLRAERTGRLAAAAWAGAAFAAAASVKIWWAAPLVCLLLWQIPRQRRRFAVPILGGAAGLLAVAVVPFFVAAPSQMWQMVVVEQFARDRTAVSLLGRARYLVGVDYLDPGAPTARALVLTLAGVAVAAVVLVASWRLRAARLAVVLLLVEVAVLCLAPSWFDFYADFLTPAGAVTVGAAAAAVRWPRLLTVARVVRVLPLVAVLVAAVATGRFLAGGNGSVLAFPSARLTAAVAGVRCLMSDAPNGLILLDSLSRDFANGCADWVDVTGRDYGPDKMIGTGGVPVPRVDNTRWQRDLTRYLTSGDAVIVVRPIGSGISAATAQVLDSGPVVARDGGYTVYATPHISTSRWAPEDLAE